MMDACEVQPVAATVLRKNIPKEDSLRPLLVPSEKNNASLTSCRPRNAEGFSRCNSGILSSPAAATVTTRRYASPTAVRTGPVAGTAPTKRSQSAERRPTTPSSRLPAPSHLSSRPTTPSSPSSRATPVRDTATRKQAPRLLNNRTPDGLWPSVQSQSSASKSEFVSLAPNNKKMVSPNSVEQTRSSDNAGTERKKTLRGRSLSEQSENARPIENSNANQYPAILGGRLTTNALFSKGVHLTDKVNKSIILSATSKVVSAKTLVPSSCGVHKGRQKILSERARRLAFDGKKRRERDWKSSVNSSSQVSERASFATWPESLSTALNHLPSSRNKFSSSLLASRGMQSPIMTRPPTSMSSSCNRNIRAGVTSSVINYIKDVKGGKKNARQIEDFHQLRLLHNAVSQWGFVNALAGETTSIQKIKTENVLYSMWNNISAMRDSVVVKRINVQNLQKQMKFRKIVKQQMIYLEHWVALEMEHYNSLSGAIEVLKASTLQLPITDGAKSDVRAVKNAMSSTVDVMQIMTSSLCNLLSKVEGTNTLVSELALIAEEEKSILNEFRELLASVAAKQLQEFSLRTHLIQLKQHAYRDEVTNYQVKISSDDQSSMFLVADNL